ncbi:unnamed protein product, partial [Owenia fusiformis]
KVCVVFVIICGKSSQSWSTEILTMPKRMQSTGLTTRVCSDRDGSHEKESIRPDTSTLKNKMYWSKVKNSIQTSAQPAIHSNRLHVGQRHRSETDDILESVIKKMKTEFNGPGIGQYKKNIQYHLDCVSRRDKDVIKVYDKMDAKAAAVECVNNSIIASQKGKGFFASRLKPYRSLGSPELDPIQLTLKEFSGKRRYKFQNAMDTKADRAVREWVGPKVDKSKLAITEEIPKFTQCNISENDDGKRSWDEYKKVKKLKRAGMDTICDLLNESAQRINAVRAGQPYGNVLKKDIKERENVIPIIKSGEQKDMVIIPITKSDELNASNHFAARQQTKLKSVREPILMGSTAVKQGSGPVNLNVLTKVMRITGKMKQKSMQLKQQNLKSSTDALVKYKAIYTVICGVLNVRTRDLKKRSPLRSDVVKQYLKHPNAERIARINFDPFPRNRRGMATGDSDSSEDLDDTDEGTHRMISRGHYASHIRHQKSDDGKPQTWDDLLTVEFKNQPKAKHHHTGHRNRRPTMKHTHGHLPALSGQMGHNTPHHHTQLAQRNVKHRIGDSPHIPVNKMSPYEVLVPDRVMVCERKPAPWQLINNKTKNEDAAHKKENENIKQNHKIGKGESKNRGQEQCKKIYRKVIESTNEALTQQKNEMLLLARHKMATFDETPVINSLFQNHRTRMEDAKSYLKWFTSGLEEVSVAQWYVELKGELDQIKKNQLKSGVKQCKTMVELETNMKKFAYADNKNLPRGREKLCLLVYSIPAELLFKHEMQSALRFVQKNILHANEKCINKWLTDRRIPLQ